ncbi:hypothetical protein [Pararhodospirillum oryzae]|nr:hypothetical protein [Pararhodospirillum oryzae]
MVALSGLPQHHKVHSLVNAGVDDLISLPVAPQALVTRILGLVNRRRPFVVTSDYTGPDRRRVSRHHPSAPGLLLDVPNTLRLKAAGQYDQGLALRAIATMRAVVDQRRKARHAERVVQTAVSLLPQLRAGYLTDEERAQVRRVALLAGDVGRHHAAGPDTMAANLCATLCDVTDRLDDATPQAQDVQTFEKLVVAFDRLFNGGGETPMTAALATAVRQSSDPA